MLYCISVVGFSKFVHIAPLNDQKNLGWPPKYFEWRKTLWNTML